MHDSSDSILPAQTVVHRDIAYVDRPTGPVRLDLFTPPGDGPFPVVIWIHGGGWRAGDKASWPHMNFLVAKGFAVANIGYRLSPVAKWPAQIDDCTAALDYLVAHAEELHLDRNRIAATGESAGGHLSAMLGMIRPASRARSSTQAVDARQGHIRAVIDLFGPTHLPKVLEDPAGRSMVEELVGGKIEAKLDVIRTASPLEYVAEDSPPFLILQGMRDTLVVPEQSERLTEALKAAGVSTELIRLPNAGHAGPEFWTPEMRQRMTAFLKRNLSVGE